MEYNTNNINNETTGQIDSELNMINELIDNLDYENAKSILMKKLKGNPNNTEYLDLYSEVLLGLDETEEAIEALKKSISLEPEKNAEKYMTLGQLSDYKEALILYQKGVNVFVNQLNNSGDNIDKQNGIKSSIASAYATIAELYMNSDLCFEPEAEDMCEKCLTEALKFDHESFDALIQISNLRILRKRDDEALKYMETLYNKITSNTESEPNRDSLLNLSKNYAELGIYVKAIKLLDIIVRISDEDLEAWYLLAFNHYNIKNYKHAMKCLKNFKKADDKISYKTDEILEFEDASKELLSELEKFKTQNGELKNNNIEESENNNEESMTNISNDCEMNIDG